MYEKCIDAALLGNNVRLQMLGCQVPIAVIWAIALMIVAVLCLGILGAFGTGNDTEPVNREATWGELGYGWKETTDTYDK